MVLEAWSVSFTNFGSFLHNSPLDRQYNNITTMMRLNSRKSVIFCLHLSARLHCITGNYKFSSVQSMYLEFNFDFCFHLVFYFAWLINSPRSMSPV